MPSHLLSVVCSTPLPFAPACHSKALRSFFALELSSSNIHFTFIYIAMYSVNKCIVLFSFALSASALTTPHAIRNVNNHRAVAVAVVPTAPEPVVISQGTLAARTVRRRSSSGRCKPKSSSTSKGASTPPANVEGAPPSVTTHRSKATLKATKPTHTSSADKHHATSESGKGKLPSFMVGTQTGQGKLIILTVSAWPNFLSQRHLLWNWAWCLWHHQ